MKRYIDTTGALARDSKTTPPTIRKYAAEGLLDYVTASNGTRLFREGQAPRVREIYEGRILRRGRRSA